MKKDRSKTDRVSGTAADSKERYAVKLFAINEIAEIKKFGPRSLPIKKVHRIENHTLAEKDNFGQGFNFVARVYSVNKDYCFCLYTMLIYYILGDEDTAWDRDRLIDFIKEECKNSACTKDHIDDLHFLF